MNTLECLEKYRVPFIHDKDAFDMLCLIALLGPIDNKELKDRIESKNKFNNNKLVELFKSGIITQNSYQQWCLSDTGSLVLSKIGVNQIVSSTIVRESLDENNLDWFLYLIGNNKNIVSSSSFYTRAKLADWVFSKADLQEEKVSKSKIYYCLFFSELNSFKNGDKTSDADLFYNEYSLTEFNKNIVMDNWISCSKIVHDSNELFIHKWDDVSKVRTESLLVSLIRLVSSSLSLTLDLSVKKDSIKKEKVHSFLSAINRWKGNSSDIFVDYIKYNTNHRIISSLESFLVSMLNDENAEKEENGKTKRITKG